MSKQPAQCLWVMLVLFVVACNEQAARTPAEVPIPSPLIVSPTPVPTSTFMSFSVAPSPSPTGPFFPIITPDPVQVERWNEYEEGLAKTFFKDYFNPEEVVCEWMILGQAVREVYVWAYCSGIYSAGPSSGSIPAVVHLGADKSVESAEIPGSGTAYGEDIRRMFPLDLQERILDHLIPLQEMGDRLRWRRGHPEEPPLIILNSLSSQPTPAVIPWITPDAVQVERWREYQTALAGSLSYLPPEQMLCEWEILGRSGNEIYVWAVCGEIWDIRVGLEGLLRIDVRGDGSVQNAIPSGTGGMGFPSEIRKMFPPHVQERYFHGLIHFQELVDHLRWRQRLGREEPPLIVPGKTHAP